ncbi:MAG: hypothetical protein ACQEW9_09700 [Bacteroidota bacterium]
MKQRQGCLSSKLPINSSAPQHFLAVAGTLNPEPFTIPSQNSIALPINSSIIVSIRHGEQVLAGIGIEISEKTTGQRWDRFHTFIPRLKTEAIQLAVLAFAGRQA